ncbi:MAG: hypothetical protein IKY84_09675 [Bacteroidaceae bacterium]|nr:hypothetical protein [Bacteroidaceae bacterium]
MAAKVHIFIQTAGIGREGMNKLGQKHPSFLFIDGLKSATTILTNHFGLFLKKKLYLCKTNPLVYINHEQIYRDTFSYLDTTIFLLGAAATD